MPDLNENTVDGRAAGSDGKAISKAVIKRLPRYYRYLGDLLNENVDRISSSELSDRMHVTASQIRQDLNNFGGFGQQGYGYNVEYLHTEIGKILCLNREHRMVILGAGNLGQAIANYQGFNRRGFILAGVFDVLPAQKGRDVAGVPVRMMDELPDFLSRNPVDIAILTMPEAHAQQAADTVIANGVKAIWNFAHLDLVVPRDVVVENVHLSESLMTLSYNLGKLGR